MLVALGGGVTGDLTGFAAATYQRGIDFVQIPTTLLAMVDSSVGGKTAVDLESGKNQVGAFYQPAVVLCDPDTLKTLPEEEYRCGSAEVLKYGVLGNAAFFESLRRCPIREQEETVIETCVGMKRDIVQEDEYDRGLRQLLNLGHTFGHAVEACSGFTLTHGQGVAIGMAMIARAAAAKGSASRETWSGCWRCGSIGLPTETDFSLKELAAAMALDKKAKGSTMHLVVPEAIGRCRILAVPAVGDPGLAPGGRRCMNKRLSPGSAGAASDPGLQIPGAPAADLCGAGRRRRIVCDGISRDIRGHGRLPERPRRGDPEEDGAALRQADPGRPGRRACRCPAGRAAPRCAFSCRWRAPWGPRRFSCGRGACPSVRWPHWIGS